MTQTRTDDLAAWLTQIWDEEERLAKAAPQERWFSTLETGDDAENFGSVWIDKGGTWKQAETIADWYASGVGEHIVAHSPGAVLPRIAADKEILRLHSGENDEPCQSWAGNYVYTPCSTLLALASPYADRPGFREEWR